MKITLDTEAKTIEILQECTLEELNKFAKEAGITDDWKVRVKIEVVKNINNGSNKPYNPWIDPLAPYKFTCGIFEDELGKRYI